MRRTCRREVFGHASVSAWTSALWPLLLLSLSLRSHAQASVLPLDVSSGGASRLGDCLAHGEQWPVSGLPSHHHSASVVGEFEIRHFPNACAMDGSYTNAQPQQQPPPSVRKLDGFFSPRDAAQTSDGDAGSRLFSSFSLDAKTWAGFESQLASASDSAAAGRQIKVLYFVRHAEGIHNRAEREYGTELWEAEYALTDAYLDADLTEFGRDDARSKGTSALEIERERGMPVIERVVVSPMARAIDTAQLFLDERFGPRPFVAIESCRETLGRHTCDKRSPRDTLAHRFPVVNFSRILSDQDRLWSPTHRETLEELKVRAHAFLLELAREVPQTHVAVVTHSGFIGAVLALLNPGQPVFKPANCEVVPVVVEIRST